MEKIQEKWSCIARLDSMEVITQVKKKKKREKKDEEKEEKTSLH